VKRAALSILFVLGFLAAGGVSGAVVAATVASGTTTGVTTTVPSSTATTTVTTQPPPPPPPPPRIASRVRIAGILVGGMDATAAEGAVRESHARPLPLLVAGRRLAPRPERLGAIAYVHAAVRRAGAAGAGAEVPLLVRVRGDRVRSYVASLAKRFDRNAVDSRLALRNLRPWIGKEVTGRSLDRPGSVAAIVRSLVQSKRNSLRLRFKAVQPAVSRASFGAIVVIRRGSNQLFLYRGMRLTRAFGVATGQSAYPTPLGSFRIVVKWRNPWWYPPPSDWAKDEKPIPPGPGNPLGTRWMGLTAPLVGIHGTPDAASIGYSASHGCIRMRISEAEWLFEHVDVGTPVFIVAA